MPLKCFLALATLDSLVFINAEIHISTVLMFALVGTFTQNHRLFMLFWTLDNSWAWEKNLTFGGNLTEVF